MLCNPIGIVKSPVKEGIDTGWGKVISEIHLDEQYVAGLTGLDSFSHVIVVFEMHKSSWNPETDLVRRPQGRSGLPLTGIFAQRAKHRPNPIGITAVKLLNIKGNTLTVRGLDAIDGTPVLDIKPYFPQFDAVAHAHTPGWVETIMSEYF